MAVIDPGPDVERHVRALASLGSAADEVTILLTHGHADHAAAAPALARATGATVLGPAGVPGVRRTLEDRDSIETDHGRLVAIHTPGHTPEHLAYSWPERSALFAGDLLLGEGDTTWVAEYPGCVADYLASLERVRAMDLAVIYPTHGPALENPTDALDRFEGHRRSRIAQVREAMRAHPDSDVEALLDVVYGGSLPDGVRGAARLSLEALVDYVTGH